MCIIVNNPVITLVIITIFPPTQTGVEMPALLYREPSVNKMFFIDSKMCIIVITSQY